MTDVSTGESQPADDLRSILAAAVTDSEKPAEIPAPKVEVKSEESVSSDVGEEAGQEVVESDGSGDQRARGPDGKFIKKEDGEEEAAPEVEAKPEEQKPVAVEPPVNWKAEDKEVFKKLPGEAQKILVQRQKDMDADYTRKTQAIAALKNEYEPVDKMFEPYRQIMAQKGFTPRSLIEAWANVEKKLADNPVEVITGLVNGYNVDRSQIARALGIGGAPQTETTEQPNITDGPSPDVLAHIRNLLAQEIAPLRQTVTTLTTERQRQQEAAQAAANQRVNDEISNFKSATDDKGNPLHPHFEEVEQHMTSLALAAKAAGQSIPPLKELYETAVWANPSTREKLRTAEMQQAEAKRKEEARAKAAAAKKAASSVTGAPSPGQSPTGRSQSDKSLREQLEEAAEDSLSAA